MKVKIETNNRAYMSERVFDKLVGRACTVELKTKTTEFGTLSTEVFGIIYTTDREGYYTYMPCIISYGVCPRKQGLHITEEMVDNHEAWILAIDFNAQIFSETKVDEVTEEIDDELSVSSEGGEE